MSDVRPASAFPAALAAMTLTTLADNATALLHEFLGPIDVIAAIKVIPGEIVDLGEGPDRIAVAADLFVLGRGDATSPANRRGGTRILVRGHADGGLESVYDIQIHAPTLTAIDAVEFDAVEAISVTADQLDGIAITLENRGIEEHIVLHGPTTGLLVYRSGIPSIQIATDVHEALRFSGLRAFATRDLEDGRTAVEFGHADDHIPLGIAGLCPLGTRLGLDALAGAGWSVA